MHRITHCRASPDYRLWVAFDDGLEGSLFLGELLEISAFGAWRDVEQFCRAGSDAAATAVVWEVGIRLDADILRQDLLSGRPAAFTGELAPALE
jgi:hypothetical protein